MAELERHHVEVGKLAVCGLVARPYAFGGWQHTRATVVESSQQTALGQALRKVILNHQMQGHSVDALTDITSASLILGMMSNAFTLRQLHLAECDFGL